MRKRLNLPGDFLFLTAILCVIAGVIGLFFFRLGMDSLKWSLVIPGVLAGIYVYVFHFRQFVYLTILLTPISVSLKDIGGGFGMSLPNEPMVFGLALAALAIALRSGFFSWRFLFHPITLIILLQTLWAGITTLFSLESEVSMKFMFSRVLYIWVFYVFFNLFFNDLAGILRFLLLYSIGFIPVMLYAMIGLGQHGFSQTYSPAMTEPFYDDHTVFGACLAMLVPVWWIIHRHRHLFKEFPPIIRNFLFVIAFSTVFCMIFSYSRAAWLSMILIWGVYQAFKFRIGPGTIISVLAALVTLILIFKEPIYDRMSESSSGNNQSLIGHASTVTDLEKDQSNLERVNRWASAVRMYEEHPFMGFGPGSYERHYGGYQMTSQMTRISTMDGDRGDAHSEYLVALSEQGLFGMIILMVLFATTFYFGMRTAFLAKDRTVRLAALGITLGLFTYYFHGAVNSFLDIDKAATLFWAFTSMVVALDINFPKSAPESRRIVPDSGASKPSDFA